MSIIAVAVFEAVWSVEECGRVDLSLCEPV